MGKNSASDFRRSRFEFSPSSGSDFPEAGSSGRKRRIRPPESLFPWLSTISSAFLMEWSIIFWTSSWSLNCSSSEIALSFFCVFSCSFPSRRRFRRATLHSSSIRLITLTSSLRRSSVRGGMLMRTILPSLSGVQPQIRFLDGLFDFAR